MPYTRLIERWLPIAELSENRTRKRRSLDNLTILDPTVTRWP